MPEGTGILRKEHEAILKMLTATEAAAHRIQSGGTVPTETLEGLIEFFRLFADKCHHGKEEDLLFPEMEKSGVPKERGPIGVMLIEHDQGRAFVKGMGEAATRYKKGGSTGLAEFTKNARDYIALLTQHINKENNSLFPMGDRAISREKQGELVEAFETLEREKIGAGTHEKFHQLLHHLQEVYLK